MEENIHNDKLDDYVRKSFDDYSEDPSEGMWDRIEGDLLPETHAAPVAPPRARPSRAIRWQLTAAAAIVLLLTGLVCEHFYYDGKIKALTAEKTKREQPAEPAKKDTANNEPANARATTPAQPMQSEQAPIEAGKNNRTDPKTTADNSSKTMPKAPEFENKTEDKNRIVRTLADKNQNLENPPAKIRTTTAAAEATGQKNETPFVKPESGLAETPSKALSPAPENTSPAANPAMAKAVPANDSANQTPDKPARPQNAAGMAEAKPGAPAFEALPARFATLENPINPGEIPARQPVKPAKLPNGWYAGIQAAPQYTLATKPPVPAQRPPGLPGIKPVFVHAGEKTDHNTDVWLKIGKKIGTRFALETGLGYRELTRNADHKVNFEFKEGKRFPGGPGGARPSWAVSYSLNTYGGAATVELRADQTDNGSVQDDEKLGFVLQTSQHLQMLRIPVLAVAKFGHGRALGVLKAGLVGNFMLKNELAITGAQSETARFSPDRNWGRRPKPPLEKRSNFIPGYWASAGFEYRLARRLSLTAEPFVSGDFAQNTSGRHRSPSYYSVGVNAGVQFAF
jgi:hypothetical protein